MTRTRLNKGDREVICDAIIAFKYDALQKANSELEHALALETYNRVYPPDIQKKMGALPRGAFQHTNRINARLSGQWIQLKYGSNGEDYILKPEFYGDISDFRALTDDPLADRILDWARTQKDLKEERSVMQGKLRATLDSFGTFDELLTAFPEAESFIMRRWRERPEGGSPGVPAVLIKDLAKHLDLPPAEQVAP